MKKTKVEPTLPSINLKSLKDHYGTGLFTDAKEYQALEKKTDKTEADKKKMNVLMKKIMTELRIIYVLFS